MADQDSMTEEETRQEEPWEFIRVPPLDPKDLSTLPQAFYDDPFFQDRPWIKDNEEVAHLRTIVGAFFNYTNDSFRELSKKEKDYCNLPDDSKKLLEPILVPRFDQMRDAIRLNAQFLNKAAENYSSMFKWHTLPNQDTFLPAMDICGREIHKLRSTLRQVVREWSDYGKQERDQAFLPCIQLVEEEFPDLSKRPEVRVLCPGSGLGRLPFEFACRAFTVQGNEFSYFMLIVSDFIMNELDGKEAITIRPNIHSTNNKLSSKDIFTEYAVPDVDLCKEIHPKADLSMASGEFIEVYSPKKEYWDVVVTCFFIDTAHNIVEYLQTIYSILKKGGIWVNLGPLLYHYADMSDEVSIELTWEEVMGLAKQVGFKIELEETKTSTYCSTGPTMLETVYHSKLIKARK
jgi:carnosine N-methyltransferase